MSLIRSLAVAAVVAAGALWQGTSHAQFGFPGLINLPKDDFTWVWGNLRDGNPTRFEDFSVQGGEAGFQCELIGKLHPGSRLSGMEVRQLENELRSNLSFIQGVAEAMYLLDQRREIDWAKLDCKKPQPSEDAASVQERVDKAREKALREQAKRRERQQRENVREGE